MFDSLCNRAAGRLAGIVAGLLMLATPLTAQDAREMTGDQVPLLLEDRPSDPDEHDLEPWDWALQSTEIDGDDPLTYLCSDLLGGECILLTGTPPEAGTCTGSCKGSARISRSEYGDYCETKEDCLKRIDGNHPVCDEARGNVLRIATAGCQQKGGKDCACFAQTTVQVGARCKHAVGGSYCRYNCTATADGCCTKVKASKDC